jgi:hypothetical protein
MTKSADQIDGPKLSRIIIEDAQLILGKKVDFDSVFHNMTEGNEHIPFTKPGRITTATTSSGTAHGGH